MTKLVFLGDLCVSGMLQPAISKAAHHFFQSADFVCINFEAPLVQPGIVPAPKAGPSIYQTELALDVLKICHVTHLSLANNHIMDFGTAGLRSTLEKLQNFRKFGAGLSYADAYKPEFIEHDGQCIALLAFGEAQFGVLNDSSVEGGFAWIDAPEARRAIREARNKSDWVIVQVHAGLEMVDIPLPEWRERYRELIDLGADLVVGHHPHVLQGSESYKNRMIYYSLGNFYMSIMFQQDDPGSGGLLEVVIENGILNSKIVPLNVTREIIDIDDSSEAQQAYQELSNVLSNESDYLKKIEDICESFWSNVYSKYYESALTGFGTKPNTSALIRIIRKFLSFFVRCQWNDRPNELMLIHNIRIESHRWVVERALSKRALQ